MTRDDSDGSSSCGGGRRKGSIGHDDGADSVTSGCEMAMIESVATTTVEMQKKRW